MSAVSSTVQSTGKILLVGSNLLAALTPVELAQQLIALYWLHLLKKRDPSPRAYCTEVESLSCFDSTMPVSVEMM